MADIIPFPVLKRTAEDEVDEFVEEMDDLSTMRAHLMLRERFPHIFERKDIDPDILTDLVAAWFLQLASEDAFDRARTASKSSKDLKRYQEILVELDV